MDYSKKHEISVYLTEEQLNQRIAEIGAQITERFKGESVYLVCILKGSIFFTTELAKRIALPMTIDFISASSYGAQTHSSGVVNITYTAKTFCIISHRAIMITIPFFCWINSL